METTETLLQKIESRRIELGWSQVEVSERAFGKSDNSAISNMKRGSAPNFDRVSQLCDALGLELYVGPYRDIGPVEQLLLEGTDFAPVHRLDINLSAGSGAENGDYNVIETLAFRRDWLDKMGVQASEAVLVKVVGDSMQPGLHDGDLALVDTTVKATRSGHVYAVTDIDAQTLVKRIDTLGSEGLLLRSDNPEFPPLIRLGDDASRVIIHGRVVWSGHVWR